DHRCLGGGGEEESSSCDPRCPTYRGKSLLHVPSLRGTGERPETRGRVSGQRRMVVAVETRAGAELPLDLKVLHRVSTFGNPERCHPQPPTSSRPSAARNGDPDRRWERTRRYGVHLQRSRVIGTATVNR